MNFSAVRVCVCVCWPFFVGKSINCDLCATCMQCVNYFGRECWGPAFIFLLRWKWLWIFILPYLFALNSSNSKRAKNERRCHSRWDGRRVQKARSSLKSHMFYCFIANSCGNLFMVIIIVYQRLLLFMFTGFYFFSTSFRLIVLHWNIVAHIRQ